MLAAVASQLSCRDRAEGPQENKDRREMLADHIPLHVRLVSSATFHLNLSGESFIRSSYLRHSLCFTLTSNGNL